MARRSMGVFYYYYYYLVFGLFRLIFPWALWPILDLCLIIDTI